MLTQEQIDDHVKAGKIAAEALQYGKSMIKPGGKVIEVLDKVEAKILELGGGIAFPAQISLNEFAAHSCSDINDKTVFDKQIVKLDVGAHVNGRIADNALTVGLSGEHEDLIKASREALDNVLKEIKIGMTLSEIGKIVQETIESYGFKPVRNLSGHGLGNFNIHVSPSIPNFENGSNFKLEEGMVIAIEPFASSGAGMIKEKGEASVFTLRDDVNVRDPITRKVLGTIRKYKGLPFAKRWLEKEFGEKKTAFALRRLKFSGALTAHKPLADASSGMVSQAEHSVIILEKPIVFTRI
jgi:methionyl aminopeptidase